MIIQMIRNVEFNKFFIFEFVGGMFESNLSYNLPNVYVRYNDCLIPHSSRTRN
jgi:hypothetical protein